MTTLRVTKADYKFEYAYGPPVFCNSAQKAEGPLAQTISVDPLLGPETEAFFAEVEQGLTNNPPDIAPMSESTSLLGDLNGDGIVDSRDVEIYINAIGACRGDARYNPIIDGDADGCITAQDERYLFPVRAPTATTVSPGFGQYSDVVTLMAQVTNSVCPGGVVNFSVNGTYAGASLVDCSGMASLPYTITMGQGNYQIVANFTNSNMFVLPSSATNTLVVSLEDAIVTPSISNPLAVQVSSPGGTAASVIFLANIKEVADGSLGNISLAAPVTMTCVPVGPGSTLSQTAIITGGGVGGALTAKCTFTNVPANVYDVTIRVGGNYYSGSANTVLAIYDPSLGFVTGGGALTHNGNSVNFGFNVKYLKNGQPQGSLLFIEHRPKGDQKLKSNAVQSLSIVNNTGIILGKATLNGVGNYSFRASVIDNGEPGSSDQFGLRVTDPLNAVVADLTYTPITLNGGNIQVPRPSHK